MLAKFGRIFVAVAVLLVGGATLFTMWSNNAANKIKDEANAAIEAAAKLDQDANAKFGLLFTDAHKSGFPGNRKEIEVIAKEAVEILEKSAADFRIAKTKFEDAAKKVTEKHVIDYWNLWAQSCEKKAEIQEARRNVAQLFLDPKYESWDQIDAASAPHIQQLDAAKEAASKAAADAQKIQDDYPNSISK